MPYYPKCISFLIFSICFSVCLVYLVFEKKNIAKWKTLQRRNTEFYNLGNIGRNMCDSF